MVLAQTLHFILWNTAPEILPDSSIPLRWYGLLFALAFLFGQYIITYIFKKEGKPEKDVDALTYWMISATVLGARLGHCLFYDPGYYLSNPIEILKIWEGGLASHGATVGILLGMWLYSRSRKDQSWLWILDKIVIVVALGGAFIRFGNLMNTEILGKPANLPWAMVFTYPVEKAILKNGEGRLESLQVQKMSGDTTIDGKIYQPLQFHLVFGRDQMQGSAMEAYVLSALPSIMEMVNKDEALVMYKPEWSNPKVGFDPQGKPTLDLVMFGIPRHPAMVYESLSTFLIFIILFLYWKKNVGQIPEGRLFSIFVVILFSLRFFYEFLKENQVDFESELPLNMGQILSIPMVMFGLWLLMKTRTSSQMPEGKTD